DVSQPASAESQSGIMNELGPAARDFGTSRGERKYPMRRRNLVVLSAGLASPASPWMNTARAADTELITEDIMLAAGGPGTQALLRNKRQRQVSAFRPDRTLLFVHGLTYASSTTFDLPLDGLSWMEFI